VAKEQLFSRHNRRSYYVLLIGVFLTSFSVLAFEITLIRILSVMLTYHYVFTIISLALLGLGAGGIFIYLFGSRIQKGRNIFSFLTVCSSLYSLAMAFSSLLIIQIGYINSIQDNILFYWFAILIPFFFAGMFLAVVFRIFPAISAGIYGADLVGAAAGCIGAIFALNILGGINAILLYSVAISVSALLLVGVWPKNNFRGIIMPAASFLILTTLLGASLINSHLFNIPIGTNREKEIFDALHGFQGKVIKTKQSAFGQIDLVEYSNNSEWMDIYLDGTAGTPMYRFNGDFKHPDSAVQSLKTNFPGYFPFIFLKEDEKNNALIIGPGGGRDVLLAMMGGVQKVTAVEVNKDLVGMVCEYSWYNGGIYTDFKNVDVVIEEGRNFLKRNKDKYDIIFFSLPVTNTSRSLEGYALTENFVFTTDSIIDYLDHLTNEGRLVVVTHNELEVLRLLSLTLAALDRRGINNAGAMKKIYIVGSEDYPVFVLKKTPFGPGEASERYKTAIHEFGYSPLSSYFPYSSKLGMLNPVLMALEEGQMTLSDVEKMVEARGYNIGPVTDNSPFFYKFNNGIPKTVSLVFWLSVIVVLLIILGPLLFRWYRQNKSFRRENNLKNKINLGFHEIIKFLVLFSMIGIGFMLVEISLIQMFVLFFGQPVLSMAVLLFSLLVGASLGSIRSGRLAPDRIFGGISNAALGIFVMLLAYIFFLPVLLNQFLAFNLFIRVSVAVIILLPLGFVMGYPFPLSVRLLKEIKMENHVPWMWGINSLSSVLGSAMTIVIAISFGFREALLVGAFCYFIVFLVIKRKREVLN